MASQVIWIITIWGCACIFLGIGIYAYQRKDPMWFYSGSQVPKESICNIPAYNKANAKMWILYSLPYFICGLTYFWYPQYSSIFLIIYAFVGLAILMLCYSKIEKKYKI